MNFLEKLTKTAQQKPDQIALKVNYLDEGISYRSLDIFSGRVLSYLKKKGISKEDFVAICLPRGVEPIIALIGVLKAGAAFVIIEENYSPERAAFIKKDCNCKFLIDYAVWLEIQHEQASSQMAPWDEHAAAFAVYTSGSTGTPKGVVHEYGNLDQIAESVQNENMQSFAEDRDALIAPLTAISSIITIESILSVAATLYVVSYAVVKNPTAFNAYLLENKITRTPFPPSMLRLFPSFGPHMRKIFVGSELVCQVYRENVKLINAYGSSETGIICCSYEIDKLYDVTPIGKPPSNLDIYLLDEDGNQVPDGEAGELCMPAPFVRGYLNRPAENARAFHEGRIYHTGDLAYKQPDGNYVLRGRLDDMININGNRIEPSEIEAVVKKVLGLEWAAAKGFLENHAGFICVYYIQDIKIDEEKTRQALQRYLPYYMIPSHFIKLDSVPLNPNLKLDRKALLPPKKEAFRAIYAAPTNAMEDQLCQAFAEALALDRIGIHDDFYQLGGDSLKAMSILTLCNIENLTASEIFLGRTPEKIAKLCKALSANDSDQTDTQANLNRSFLLTPEQHYMIDYQLYASKSTMYNLTLFMKLHEQIDANRFSLAVSQTIARHPALLTVFDFNEDGDMMQHYDATLAKPIAVEQVSERALSALKDTLIFPYSIVGNPLYRCRIFKTEASLYLFFDVHHTVCDGSSLHILLHDIDALYGGEATPLEDDYYNILAQNVKIKSSQAYTESLNYFKNRYDKQEFAMLEPYASKTSENRLDVVELFLPKIQDLKFIDLPQQQALSNNVLFLAITSLALASHCKSSCVSFTWTYNGRSSIKHMATVGLLFDTLPLSLILPGSRKFADILEDVTKQVNLGIQHGAVYYLAERFQSMEDDSVNMLYQDTLYNFDMLCGQKIEIMPIKNSYAAAQSALDIEICQQEDETMLLFKFNSGQFEKPFIQGLADICGKVAKKLSTCSSLHNLTVDDLIGQ